MNSRVEQRQLSVGCAMNMLCSGMIQGLPKMPGVVGGSAWTTSHSERKTHDCPAIVGFLVREQESKRISGAAV